MPIQLQMTPEEAMQKLETLLHMVNNMRFSQKYWHEHFGHNARERKTEWEKKVDDFLNQHGLTEHNKTKAIQVIRK